MSQVVVSDVFAVIRSADERTLDVCRRRVEEQVSPPNVVVIKEVPFVKALCKTYELGIAAQKPWTLAVDADILVRGGAVQSLVQTAERTHSTVYEIQGRIVDKLGGSVRDGGLHLYRTSLLEEALRRVPTGDDVVRPECATLLAMGAAGYPMLQLSTVVGLHDFEQYYRDVYRKAFFHAYKSSACAEHWERLWRRYAQYEPDFRVALLGLAAGKRATAPVTSDIRQFATETVASELMRTGMEEKGPLCADAVTDSQVERCVRAFAPSLRYVDLELDGVAGPARGGRARLPRRIRELRREFGWFGAFCWSLGWWFALIGVTAQSRVEKRVHAGA